MNKILIIVNKYTTITNFRMELLEKLIEDNYDITIASPFNNLLTELKSNYKNLNFIYTKLNRRSANPFEGLRLIREYRKIIKEIKPNIVLTFTIKPNVYGSIAANKYNIPIIANITGLGTALENKGILQKITTILYKIAFKKINTVFFQNEENMSFFKDKKIAVGKHKLLPGSGVNLEHFQVLPYPTDEIIRFVFVSRIMKEKGIDYYLKAAKYFKDKYDNVEFHVCGFFEENYKQIFEDYIEKEIIIYHGLVSDVREVFKDMHAIIHPTYYPEGMSNVLLEAAATGRPGIATNRSGCREIIEDNDTGYLFEMHNSQELISKIDNFINLSNKNKQLMGVKARTKVQNEFNRDIVIKKYTEEIKIILEGRK